jgi:hypothetical protein
VVAPSHVIEVIEIKEKPQIGTIHFDTNKTTLITETIIVEEPAINIMEEIIHVTEVIDIVRPKKV